MELHCLPLLPHHISNPFQRSHSVLFQFQVNFVPFFSSSLIFYLIRLNHSSSEVSFWLAFFFFYLHFYVTSSGPNYKLTSLLCSDFSISSYISFFVCFCFFFISPYISLSQHFYQAIFLKPAITVS